MWPRRPECAGGVGGEGEYHGCDMGRGGRARAAYRGAARRLPAGNGHLGRCMCWMVGIYSFFNFLCYYYFILYPSPHLSSSLFLFFLTFARWQPPFMCMCESVGWWAKMPTNWDV